MSTRFRRATTFFPTFLFPFSFPLSLPLFHFSHHRESVMRLDQMNFV